MSNELRATIKGDLARCALALVISTRNTTTSVNGSSLDWLISLPLTLKSNQLTCWLSLWVLPLLWSIGRGSWVGSNPAIYSTGSVTILVNSSESCALRTNGGQATTYRPKRTLAWVIPWDRESKFLIPSELVLSKQTWSCGNILY